MEYKKFGNQYVVRLDIGDEIMESITEFAKKENIKLAKVSAIGALKNAVIGYFSTTEKRYYSKNFDGEYEILSLQGNISQKDGEPYIHLHIIIGGEDYISRGGHFNSGIVTVTCEIIVDMIDGMVERTPCKKTGINIFNFE